ncbi:MAG: hypothetical protein IKR85_08190, partial [Clostridia bacterium]|nr:hypothetical protein [Clostridia bacterium]
LRDFPGARRTASNRRFEPMRPAEGGIDLPMVNQPQTEMKRVLLWSSSLPTQKSRPRAVRGQLACWQVDPAMRDALAQIEFETKRLAAAAE